MMGGNPQSCRGNNNVLPNISEHTEQNLLALLRAVFIFVMWLFTLQYHITQQIHKYVLLHCNVLNLNHHTASSS